MYIKNTELAQNNKVEISPSALVIIVNESDLNFQGKGRDYQYAFLRKRQ